MNHVSTIGPLYPLYTSTQYCSVRDARANNHNYSPLPPGLAGLRWGLSLHSDGTTAAHFHPSLMRH